MRTENRTRMDDIRIAENVTALIRRDKVYKACKLNKGKKVHFDKLSFLPDCAFGHYYGSQFEVRCQQLIHIVRSEPSSVVGGAVVGVDESGLDNRDIVDDGSAQPLRESDILHLRAHVQGQDVVGTVVEHSTSFRGKTKYSQEKYVNKKKKKHVPVISILKPSTRALCDMYYSRGPSKICHMRIDTVAQILTYSNIHANTNMVVMETTQGLLLTAMLERMGGFGKVVQVFFGDFPVRLAVDNASHLSEKDKSSLLEYPLHRIGTKFPASRQSSVLSRVSRSAEEGPLLDLSDSSPDPTDSAQHSSHDSNEARSLEEELDQPQAKRVKLAEKSIEVARGGPSGEGDSVESLQQSGHSSRAAEGTKERREKRRQEREARYSAAEALLEMRNMDGLILACRFHPEPLLMALLGLVAPSRPIVIYCHLLDPLIECYRSLKRHEEIVFDVQISETWTRYYQVLTERTHPEMSMDGQGGYILTATTTVKIS